MLIINLKEDKICASLKISHVDSVSWMIMVSVVVPPKCTEKSWLTPFAVSLSLRIKV